MSTPYRCARWNLEEVPAGEGLPPQRVANTFYSASVPAGASVGIFAYIPNRARALGGADAWIIDNKGNTFGLLWEEGDNHFGLVFKRAVYGGVVRYPVDAGDELILPYDERDSPTTPPIWDGAIVYWDIHAYGYACDAVGGPGVTGEWELTEYVSDGNNVHFWSAPEGSTPGAIVACWDFPEGYLFGVPEPNDLRWLMDAVDWQEESGNLGREVETAGSWGFDIWTNSWRLGGVDFWHHEAAYRAYERGPARLLLSNPSQEVANWIIDSSTGQLVYSPFFSTGATPWPVALWFGTMPDLGRQAGTNLHTRLAQYVRSGAASGGIQVQRATHAVPPYELTAQATDTAGDTHPTLAEEPSGRLWQAFTRQDDAALRQEERWQVMLHYSDDDGGTWSEPETLFRNARLCRLRVGPHGELVALAFRWDKLNSTLSLPAARIVGRIREPGEAEWGAEFDIQQEDAGTLVYFTSLTHDAFDLDWRRTTDAPWVLAHHRILYVNGILDDTIRYRLSWDEGRTWQAPDNLVENADVLFIGATRPRVRSGPHGEVLFLARAVETLEDETTSGRLVGRLWEPGESEVGAEFTLVDDTGTALPVADDLYDVSWAAEGPLRWVLTVRLEDEDSPSDWVSTDEGRTWKRVEE